MNSYREFSDDYYINMHLHTEMDLPQSRETVLYFFEQLQKQYPEMKNFYGREHGEYVLEENKDRGDYRWATVENRRVSSGMVNPDAVDDALGQHRKVLESAPYSLSISPLDCESLNVMFAFDFTYRGNHNDLLAEALGITPAFEKMSKIEDAKMMAHEPSLQLSLDSDCRIQCRLSIEPRTSAYSIRTGEFPEEQLSVYFTVRRYGSLDAGEDYVTAMDQLASAARGLIEGHVIESVLMPLKETIAIK